MVLKEINFCEYCEHYGECSNIFCLTSVDKDKHGFMLKKNTKFIEVEPSEKRTAFWIKMDTGEVIPV